MIIEKLNKSMKLLPYRAYKIEIRHSKSEFENQLLKTLTHDKNVDINFFKVRETTFNGEINNGCFKMSRNGFGNVSLVPMVKGKIIENINEKKTYLELQIGFDSAAYIFLSFWFGFVIVIFILSILNYIISHEFNLGILASLFMFFVPYGGIMLGFTEEVKTIKRYFYKKLYYKF
jgi:hypothetical protein